MAEKCYTTELLHYRNRMIASTVPYILWIEIVFETILTEINVLSIYMHIVLEMNLK